MDADALIANLATTARLAARTLSTSTGLQRAAALLAIADEIVENSAKILLANAEDLERGGAQA